MAKMALLIKIKSYVAFAFYTSKIFHNECIKVAIDQVEVFADHTCKKQLCCTIVNIYFEDLTSEHWKKLTLF